jgi:HAD superfamily phosphoserine phosphatase-like hydrolase
MEGNCRRPLAGFVVATDVDGTITPRDTIFDFFDEFGLLEKAKELYEAEPGSDVSIILNEITSKQAISERVFKKIADRAEFFPKAAGFYPKLEELGAKICLLTSTYEPIARRIAERLRLKKPIVCATRVRKRNGFVTGFVGPVLEGREKEKALVRVCLDNKVPLSKTVGIADSDGDAFFMERISRASGLCVWVSNPDFSKIERLVLSGVRKRNAKKE